MNDTHHHNSISAFARLLATENIRVRHLHSAHTASFDMVNRILTLPQWQNMTPRLYDMLVGHEVAHALFTDATVADDGLHLQAAVDIDPNNPRNAMPVINIVEDARIERLIKAKYPGLKRDFSTGYKQLYDMDIFQIADQGGVSKMGILDRLNLHFKLGILGILDIPMFNDTERSFVDRLANTQSWQDVVDVSRDLYEYALEEQQQMSNAESDLVVAAGGNGDDDGDEKSNGAADGEQQDGADGSAGSNSSKGMLESSTQAAFDNAKSETPRDDAYEPGIIDLPRMNMDRIIVSADTINDMVMTPRYGYDYDKMSAGMLFNHRNTLSAQHALCDQFMNDEKSTVNNLVKQFEMRKAADEHRRTNITKSGRLDTIKMINYKWSEDIFAKNTVVNSGKNHGFVIVLDWSGSMQNNLLATVKQAITLAMFCRRANIPFDLYAFTDRVRFENSDYTEGTKKFYPDYDTDSNIGNLFKPFHMLHFLTSSCNNRQFVTHCRNLFSLALNETYCYRDRGSLPQTITDTMLSLGGTPLEESILALHEILPVFRAKHRVQILNTVILSDGDSCGANYVIHNPKTRRTYGYRPEESVISYRNTRMPRSSTMMLLKSLRDATDTRLVGMYLTTCSNPAKRGLGYNWLDPYNTDEKVLAELEKSWKNNRFFVAPGEYSNYFDEAYVVDANLNPDSDLNLPDSANTTRTQLRNAFVKGMKSKSMSRLFTNRFIEVIAR